MQELGLYPKNPAQHSMDLKMLSDVSELKPAFINAAKTKELTEHLMRVPVTRRYNSGGQNTILPKELHHTCYDTQ